MQSMARIYCLSLMFLLLLTACGGSGGSSKQSYPDIRGYLVSATLRSAYTSDQINDYIALSGLPLLNASYAVNTYKIVYRTVDTDGNFIDASGLLAVPQKSEGLQSPILSLQHGTIFLDSDSPSNNLNENIVAAVVGSQGFIVAMPDYIGYGTSSGRIHPYVHAESLASSVIDLVRAVRRYLSNNAILENGQLFLAGYSEGGYATLAAHKVMQEELSAEFTVTASVPGAGPYDMTQTANTILGAPTLAYAPNVAFLFKAYDSIYGWNRIDEFFRNDTVDYVTVVNTSFDGTKSGATIDASLTSVTADLINAIFLTDFLNSGQLEVKAALAENDIYDWAPNAPVRLFHGMDDLRVPYVNATTAETIMQLNGASDVMVETCVGVVPANHNNCFEPFAIYAITYLTGLASDL